ncbi:hypothetical protein HRbin36_02009 [bacterium HR36]|nr:hypothetical protein HRbin36_02009 [bacterium HR36]
MSTTARGGQVGRSPRGPTSDELLLRELQRTAERIRLVDIATAGLMLAVAWATYLLAIAVVDQALRPAGLPSWIRQALFLALVAGSGIFAWFGLIRPAFHKVSLLYAAWRLEKTARVTRHAVTAYLDLRQRRLPVVVREALRREAQEDMRYADPEAAAPHNPAMRWFFVLVGLFILLGVFALFVPEQFLSLVGRAFWPFAPTAIPADTRFELLAPERDGPYVEPHRQPVKEIPVKRGQMVSVHVRVHGLAPPEVWLETWVQEGEQPVRRNMTALDDYRTEWKFALGASDLPASGLFFRVVGGDGRSRIYRLVEQLVNPPEVREFDITIHYPAYTAREPKKQTIGAIEALVGSEIELAVYGDQPITEGELVLEYGEPTRRETLRLVQAPDRDPQHQNNRVVLDDRLRVDEKWLPQARYGVRLRNAHRQTGSTQWFDLRLLTDQPPMITLEQVNRVALPPADPQAKEPPIVQLPLGTRVAVEGTANDDFAVDRVWLVLQETDGARRLLRIAHEQAETGPLQKANGFTPIVPASYTLTLDLGKAVVVDQSREVPQAATPVSFSPGTKLKLWVEGTDCKRPEPNLGRSREILVELIEPQTPPPNSESASKPSQENKRSPEQKPQDNPPQANKPEANPSPEHKPESKPGENKPDKAPSPPDKANPENSGTGQGDNQQQGKPSPDKAQAGDKPHQQPDKAQGGTGQQANQNPDKSPPQAHQGNDNAPPQNSPDKASPSDKPQAGNQAANNGAKPQGAGQGADKPQANNVPNQPAGGSNDQRQNKPQPNANAGGQAGDKPQKPNAGTTGQTPNQPENNAQANNQPGGTQPIKPENSGAQSGTANNQPQGNNTQNPNQRQNPNAQAGNQNPPMGNKPADNSPAGANQQPNANPPNKPNANSQAQGKPEKPAPGGPG